MRFGIEDCEVSAAVTTKAVTDIDEKDFRVTYNPKANVWIMLWKWRRGSGPARLLILFCSILCLGKLDKSMKMSCISGSRMNG